MNDQDTQKQNKGKNKALIILLLTLIVICLAIILVGAYAKYVTGIQASADAKVADFICTMDVTPCESSKEIVNPYCTVTVKNYDNKHIAETDIDFKVTVTSKDEGGELPEYKWYKLDSTEDPDGEKEVGSISTFLQDTIPVSFTDTGEQQQAQRQEQKYKIVFINPGDEDVTKNLQFELDAVQKKPEK